MVITILVGLFLFAPLAQFLTSPQARLRFYEVNIFSDISIIEKTNQEITNDDNAWWSKILHNRRFAYSLEFLRHYFDHFNPAFLFIKGDGNPKFSTQDVGQLYLWDLPFLILGILLLFKRREGIWWIIPLWLLIGIIPAGTARETPHALRIEASLPTWQILIAIGIFGLLEYLRKIELKSSLKVLASCFVFSCLILNFIYYYHGYWTHYATEFSNEWQYGYKEAIYFVKEVQDRYNKIIFTDKLGRPYIYFLFYTKENPENFRQSAKIRREVFGFVHVDGYGKYRFDKDLNSDPAGERTLFIDTPEEVPSNALILKTFYLLDREQVLVAYTK